jgi:hypothetical protein
MRTQAPFQLHMMLCVLRIPDFIQGMSLNAGYTWIMNVIASLIFTEDSKLNRILFMSVK